MWTLWAFAGLWMLVGEASAVGLSAGSWDVKFSASTHLDNRGYLVKRLDGASQVDVSWTFATGGRGGILLARSIMRMCLVSLCVWRRPNLYLYLICRIAATCLPAVVEETGID